MKVENTDPRPAYAQVADDLRASIRAGRYVPGDRLPSGQALSAQYGVAVMTVRKALDVLRDEGLLVAHQGRGVFVSTASAEPAVDELADLRAAVVDLSNRVEALEEQRRP